MLPHFPGSTWRGALVAAFRRVACLTSEAGCHSCLLKQGCPYPAIFEPSLRVELQDKSFLREIPRPFVIEPATDTREPAQPTRFDLLLFGEANKYLGYFIVAAREMARRGLTQRRVPCLLKRVALLGADDRETDLVLEGQGSAQPLPSTPDPKPPPVAAWPVALQFLTPTRLKFQNAWCHTPSFHVLLSALVRRASLIASIYGRRPLPDLTTVVERTRSVRTLHSSARWVDWQRYSSRQQARLTMGGIVGDISYDADPADFAPILRLGELIHVGKGCVFGMGRFRLLPAL